MKTVTSISVGLVGLAVILGIASQVGASGASRADASKVAINTWAERGEELYNQPVSCHVCHAKNGEGLIGPTLLNGPTPAEIYEQLRSNPTMGVIAQEMKPTDDDLVAIAVYLRQLAKLPTTKETVAQYQKELIAKKNSVVNNTFVLTERDKAVQKIELFETVLETWERRAKPGNIGKHYQTRELATFDKGETKFTPEKNTLYFYENLGNSANLSILDGVEKNAESTQVVVGNATTHEVLASYEIPVALKASVHTTAVSGDGKYVYIVGARGGGGDDLGLHGSSASLLKVDAFTLQPIKQVSIGGRLHHGQLFQDKYLLLDTFAREPTGLDIFLYDTDTDKVVGGVRDEELGGATYTAWADGEYIYALMEPGGYSPGSSTGMVGATNLNKGRLVAMRPFWIAKIDPKKWEVVKEYPFPGFRGDWIVVDAAKEYMYVTSGGSSNASKIRLKDGEIMWTSASGIGPYGASLTADEKELWIADKGESTGHFGRTITVLDTESGQQKETVFSGYEVDHLLLSPDGKEMWATSNGEGRIYVFDAATRKQKAVMDMPQYGDPHGLVWVYYDKEGVGKVVRDQGGFANGINPALGKALQL